MNISNVTVQLLSGRNGDAVVFREEYIMYLWSEGRRKCVLRDIKNGRTRIEETRLVNIVWGASSSIAMYI